MSFTGLSSRTEGTHHVDPVDDAAKWEDRLGDPVEPGEELHPHPSSAVRFHQRLAAARPGHS